MRIVVQRVQKAGVTVEGRTVGAIGPGLALLIGFSDDDREEAIPAMAEKIVHLRIFEDEQGKMNRSLLETGGAILAVSQFTLYADTSRGRRPNFLKAAKPEVAEPLYEKLVTAFRERNVHVETGVFGAMMNVEIHNDGPVTILLE